MGYLSNLNKRVKELFDIKTPMIWIVTQEEELAEKAVVHYAAKANIARHYYYSSMANGDLMDPITLRKTVLRQSQELGDMFAETTDAFHYPDVLPNLQFAVRMLTEAPDSVMLVIRDNDDIFSVPTVQRALYDVCARHMCQNGVYHPIVMISPNKNVPEMLRGFTTTIELPLMNEEENFMLICHWLKTNSHVVKKEDALNAARAATGLTSIQLRHALDDSWNRTMSLDTKIINDVRIEVIKQSNVLTYIEPKKTLDTVGGHGQLKNWIREVKLCMTPEAKAAGVDEAKGFIAMGQAGTGKTAMAEAIANYFNIPLIIFDLSKIMGGIVGQSEQTARRVFETIRSIGRCVVLIDECDKAFAGASDNASISDGGTIKRVFDVVLQALNSNEKQFYILTANNVSKLPAPLTRAGRLDNKWFFNFPNEEERKEILNIYFKEKNLSVDDELIDYAARICKNYTGAEIMTAVKNINRMAFLRKSAVTKHLILDGVSQVCPVYKTNPEEVEELNQYAEEHKIPATSSSEADKVLHIDSKAEKRMQNALNACTA